jgi:hypothetical protein
MAASYSAANLSADWSLSISRFISQTHLAHWGRLLQWRKTSDGRRQPWLTAART